MLFCSLRRCARIRSTIRPAILISIMIAHADAADASDGQGDQHVLPTTFQPFIQEPELRQADISTTEPLSTFQSSDYYLDENTSSQLQEPTGVYYSSQYDRPVVAQDYAINPSYFSAGPYPLEFLPIPYSAVQPPSTPTVPASTSELWEIRYSLLKRPLRALSGS